MKSTICDYGMNGEGVAKIDGKVFLIPGAVLDEEVEFDINKDFKNYAQCSLTKIYKKSKNRQIPPCPYVDKCGGCGLQHMVQTEQLKFKSLLIKKTIKKICGIDVKVDDTIPSNNEFYYRNKASFNVGNSIGFYKQNSHDIVDINECKICSQNINKVLQISKSFFENLKLPVSNIVVRDIENQILVGVVTKQKTDLTGYLNLLQSNFKNIGLYEIINTRKDSVVISGKVIHIGGIKEIQIKNFDIDYSVDIESFHQTNLDIQNKLYDAVLTFIHKKANVINGFSGQGLLSAIIAKKAKSVIGIEINKSAHLSSEKLKKLNKIQNLTNICGDFNKEILKIKNYDTIILDPAKRGCGDKTMQAISNAKRIIYISCSPIALAKDLRIILGKYDIEKVIPFDMFPNTNNVETLVVLNKK